MGLFNTFGARTHLAYLHTPLKRNLAQNRARREGVAAEVFYRPLVKLEVPDLTEVYRLTMVKA